jgi:hypothetical protein
MIASSWPPQQRAAVVRIVFVAFAGVMAVYLIGRWEARLSADEREHQDRVDQVLGVAQAFHRSQDSLRAIGDSLHLVDSLFAKAETRAAVLLGQLEAVDSRERDSVESTPLDDLLPSLRLRAVRTSTGAQVFAADSAGVRFLAGRMLLLSQARRRITTLGNLADARAGRIVALGGQLHVALLRADSAEKRIPALEELLEDSERLRRRQGKWLGFLPKPSPLVTFLIGAGACYILCPRPG